MVPQATRPATITRHTAPVRLRLNAVQSNIEPNGGKTFTIHIKFDLKSATKYNL